MWIVFAAKYWREIIIVFLAFLLAISLAVLNYKTGQLKEAEQKCQSQIQEIERKNLKALAEKQNQINKVSADYEQVKAEQNTKVEYIEREVQKMVERPFISLAVLMMTGCSNSMNSLKPVIPANLIQPCPNLNELAGTTGKDLMIWSVDTVAKYNDCKARHGALVKALE